MIVVNIVIIIPVGTILTRKLYRKTITTPLTTPLFPLVKLLGEVFVDAFEAELSLSGFDCDLILLVLFGSPHSIPNALQPTWKTLKKNALVIDVRETSLPFSCRYGMR